jgi:2',3'-cyclic-nucleotide 2'-phosphodiesterase/3'-nucleotidase
MKKRLWPIFIVFILSLFMLSGCKTTEPQEAAEQTPVTEMPQPEEVQEPEPEPVPTADQKPAVAPLEQSPVVEPVEMRDDILVKIVSTGGVHGRLFSTDLIDGTQYKASLSQFHRYLEQQSSEYGDRLILLDSGNMLQGDLLTEYWDIVNLSDGDHIIAQVMNTMGYDAAAAGHKDLMSDVSILETIDRQTGFPALSANIISEKTGELLLPAHTVINTAGISVAVIGLTSMDAQLPKGYALTDAVSAADAVVDRIDADIVVALMNSSQELARELAQKTRGIDLIIAGDQVMTVLNRENRPVHIAGTQPYSEGAASAELIFSWDGDAYELADISTSMVDITSYDVSQKAMEMFSFALEEFEAAVMTQVGYLSDTFSTQDALFSDSALVDMIHNLQLAATGAQISFASAPVAGIPLLEGPIYLRDVIHALQELGLGRSLPSLYVVEMIGSEIDAYLEHSYGMWYRSMASIDEGLLAGRDIQLYDTAAGINYIVDVRKPAGDKVKITTTAAGKKFEQDERYTVVLNELRAQDVGGYLSGGLGVTPSAAQERVKRIFHIDLVENLLSGESMIGTLVPETDDNWFASPRVWAQRGAEKDKEQL